jgi:hypothetical protein
MYRNVQDWISYLSVGPWHHVPLVLFTISKKTDIMSGSCEHLLLLTSVLRYWLYCSLVSATNRWISSMTKRRKRLIGKVLIDMRCVFHSYSTKTLNERRDTEIPSMLWPWPNFTLASTHIIGITCCYSVFKFTFTIRWVCFIRVTPKISSCLLFLFIP